MSIQVKNKKDQKHTTQKNKIIYLKLYVVNIQSRIRSISPYPRFYKLIAYNTQTAHLFIMIQLI